MLQSLAAALADLLLAERERWSLWLPVILGAGIAFYLGLAVEPSLVVCLVPVLAASALLALAPAGSAIRVAVIALLALGTGFAAAKIRAELVGTPVLGQRLGPVVLTGLVAEIEARPDQRPRMVLERATVERLAPAATPRRLRLSFDPAMPVGDIAPGDRIEVRAILLPPPGPAMPGAPDHGRSMWFDGIGAVGYALDPPSRLAGPAGGEAGLAAWRHRVGEGIVQAMPAPEGGIAAALMVGERGAVPEMVEERWRAAGISHILSISGLHLGLAAGVVLFGLRLVLAGIAPISLRWPVKKWAAAVAILSAAGYMVVAGMDVPAQRSFIMTAIVLLAVIVDRLALTLRLVALAAAAILLLEPEALTAPGFGMSFASVTGLVAGFEAMRGPMTRWRSGAGLPGRGVLWLGAILASSMIATVATAPFAIAHFGRLSLYGLVANLIAVPVTALAIMPAAVAAAALMPFGLEAPALYVLGQGIAFVDWIAILIAAWPGASLAVPAMGQGALALFVLGGLCLCLWQGWLRLAALPLALAGVLVWMVQMADAPLLLVHEEGRAVAAPVAGHLQVLPPASPAFVVEQWTERLGLAAAVELRRDRACAGGLCSMTLPGGTTVTVIERAVPDTLPCASIVIARAGVLPRRWPCDGLKFAIDRADLRRLGTFALTADGQLDGVADDRGDRPWTPAWWRGRDAGQ